MKRPVYYIAILMFAFFPEEITFAQNDLSWFRFYPSINETMPEWAKKMYADDPNIFEVDQLYDEYHSSHPFVKDIHVRNYIHWRKHISQWINHEGKIRLLSKDAEEAGYEALKNTRNTGHIRSNVWTHLGPVETYEPETLRPISMQANVYSIDRSLTDPATLLAGTEAGGAYLSKDKGGNWNLITKYLPVRNVDAVKIHPLREEVLLIAANRRIYRSENSGENWEELFFTDASKSHEIQIARNHENIIFCSAANGLYRSADNGISWTKIIQDQTWDIQQHPTDDSVFYALVHQSGQRRSIFLKSEDLGETWKEMTQGWYVPQESNNAIDAGGKIGLTPAAPDQIYAALIGQSKQGDSGWIGVWRSDNAGENWYMTHDQIGGPYQSPNNMPWNLAAYHPDGYHQGFYNFCIAVSHNNPERLWIGTVRLSESTDGGKTFTSIGAADSRRHSHIHADIQDMEVYGDEIWIATDGGVDFSDDELQNHISLKKGIIAADYWGFGAGWNEDVLFGGKYHNGNGAYFQSYGHGNFLHVGGVEEPTGYVNPLDNRTLYYNRYWTEELASLRIPDIISGNVVSMPSIAIIPNEHYVESSSSGLYFDPAYAGHMIMGSEQYIWKSTDGGGSFEVLHDFGTGKVYEIEISRSNPGVMYAVYHEGGFWDGCVIYTTRNGGNTWQKITDIPGDKWRLEISLNPENDLELWVASSRGNNGQKVFQTLDGGQTWINKSTPLMNDQRMKDIFFQGGTDDVVYLATDHMVLYHMDGEWHEYSDGLPFSLHALQFKPFYRDKKIRLATYGTGVWEAPMVADSRPVAQAITTSDIVYCSRDTVLLDCHSILHHEGASWQWSIHPEPVYADDMSQRRIRAVLGDAGSYSVTLHVSDGSGKTSLYIADSMIEVRDICGIEDKTGLAFESYQTGDYVQLSDMGVETNTFTVMAWIKPNGIQDDYSAIYMNDDATAGFNFKSGNNTLGYHWPNGAWWWSSDLQVPSDEWSHVAMVVQPAGITVHVNGKIASHPFQVPPVKLGTGKLGSYKAWGGRTYYGAMDEVSFWNRPLTIDEVRKYRHIHLSEENIPEGLIHYYQFNEPEGTTINDRVGNSHGRMTGAGSRIISTAPVGVGEVAKISTDGKQVLELPEVGWSASFSQPLPIGNVYVTRLQSLPDIIPVEREQPYWIVNQYIEEDRFSPDTMIFSYTGWGEQPFRANLFYRTDNADGPVWEEVCSGLSSDGEKLVFAADCDLTLDGQFYPGDPDLISRLNAVHLEPMQMYPNPVMRGQDLILQVPENGEGRLRLFNAQGRLVGDQILYGKDELRFNIGNLIPGTYFFQWRTNKSIRHGSFVVVE